MLYSILHSCFAGLYVLLYMLNCCTAVSAALRRSCLRHLFLAPSLRAPVRTAAVYVPTLTYAAVYPTDVVVIATALPTYRQYYVREHVPVPFLRYAVELV